MRRLLNLIDLGVIAKNVFYAFATVIGSVVVSFWTYQFVMSVTPPLKYTEVRILTPEVSPGGVMLVSFSFERRRFCRTDIDRFIVTANNDTLVWRDTVPGGASEVGTFSLIGKVPIKADIEPGEYKFFARSYATCQEGLHMATHPRLAFRVVK